MLPGKKISKKNIEKYRNLIFENLNPDHLTNMDLIKSWTLLNEKFYADLNFIKNNSFYLLYKHPIHDFKDELSIVDHKELSFFLKENISFERYEGLDLFIWTSDFKHIFACNHDGEIFMVK